jgi:hypothetical protein
MACKKRDARLRDLRVADEEGFQRFDLRALLHAFVREAEADLDDGEL